MKAADLYRQAAELGLRLERRGDQLGVAPATKCPPEFADVLRQHKADLLQWLNSPHCPGWQATPPHDLPLNLERPRPGPEHARLVMDFVVRQINGLDVHCEWCLKRETAYWDGFHWPVQACCYASARDAACWQLARTEQELWSFLGGLNEVAKQT